MVTSDKTLMRLATPALAVLATIVALFGPWFTRTTSVTQHTMQSTLLDVLQGNSFVEYTSTRWLWISAVGVVLVIASVFVSGVIRRKLAQTGSYLMAILPGWSLLQVYAGNENIGAGWGMWVVAIIAIAIVILARFIPQDNTQYVAPQVEHQN